MMSHAFILFGLLIVANPNYLIRSSRRAREQQTDNA